MYGALWTPTDRGIWLLTITANAGKLSPERMHTLILGARVLLPFSAVALAAALCLLFQNRGEKKADAVVALYFLISLPWSLLAFGRMGSWYGYFIESAVSGSLAIALLVHHASYRERRRLFRGALAVVALFILFQTKTQLGLTSHYCTGDDAARARVREILKALPVRPDEYVLSDSWSTMFVVEAGHRPLVIDSAMYTFSAANGLVSSEPMLAALRKKQVPYVVVHAPLGGDGIFPKDVMNYLVTHFKEVMKVSGEDSVLLYKGPD